MLKCVKGGIDSSLMNNSLFLSFSEKNIHLRRKFYKLASYINTMNTKEDKTKQTEINLEREIQKEAIKTETVNPFHADLRKVKNNGGDIQYAYPSLKNIR